MRARNLMRRYGVRHLPVVDDRGKLVGVVSERDVNLALAAKPGWLVEYVMSPKPFSVGPETPLTQVARAMVEHRYGSAVVVGGGAILGIFTATDGLAALVESLEGKQLRPAYEAVAMRPPRPRTRLMGREARR